MLDRITLRFGPAAPGASPLVITPAALTVFVGPNHSGKSLLLREIERFTRDGPRSDEEYRILYQLHRIPQTQGQVMELLTSRRVPANRADGAWEVLKMSPYVGERRAVDPQNLSVNVELGNPEYDPQLLGLVTGRLDGQTRLALLNQAGAGDTLEPPANILQALTSDDAARMRVRSAVHEAFNRYFVIDATHLGVLRVRLSTRPPTDPAEEQAFDLRARQFHQQAALLDHFSDGVRAFCGMVAAVVAGDFRILLVDEPEAFLHPPLVRRLARWLSQSAAEKGGNAIVATHSADFVVGAVDSGVPVNIVRLTYQPRTTASLLPADALRTMMHDPLLRSTNLLSALFYEGAVICEGDADRAFYSEINARLLSVGLDGADDAIFLTSYNWQSEHRMVAPLRSMGIPAAAIVDLDALRKAEFRDLLAACGMPAALVQGAGQTRGQIAAMFERDRVNIKAGIEALANTGDREACREFLRQLAVYGLFVVPVGEVEGWLALLGVTAAKPAWLPAMFERLGAEPTSPGYVHPADNDVWAFIRSVSQWLRDPDRRGMSAAA